MNENIGVQISFLNINSTNIDYELSHELSEQHIDIYNTNATFYTNYGIPYSVNNSDIIRALTKELTTIPIITANKQIPQQEIEHKANTNKVIQLLFHIDKKLYNTTTLKVFQFLSIYLPI